MDAVAQPVEIDASAPLRDLTAEAWRAIAGFNAPPVIFQRNGEVVQVVRRGDRCEVQTLSIDRMRHLLARVASWKSSQRETRPSLDVVRDVLATPTSPLPELREIVGIPVLDRHGNVVDDLGYSPLNETFYAPTVAVPPVPTTPSVLDLVAARSFLLDELLGDFPFTDDASRAHAVALLLLPFVRRLIDGPTPLHVIDKPVPGTGGSLLATALLAPALGTSVPVMAEARLEDEFRFRLTSTLAQRPIAILFDNITKKLTSGALAAAITSERWEDRPVGSGTLTSVSVTCAWVVTGNEVKLSAELGRRAAHIRLDAGVRPEDRTGFKHPHLIQWVKEHRGDLIWSALVLTRAWLVAGAPRGQAHLPSFESYAEVMSGILDVAGVPGFLTNRPAPLPGDGLEGFVQAWTARYGTDVVTASDLVPFTKGEFGLGGKSKRAAAISLGIQLGELIGRRFGDYTIETVGRRAGARRYRLQPVS